MVGLGVAYAGGLFTNRALASSSSPYAITLLETMNPWNSTSPPQPRFFVLGNNGLESSANIILPAHRQIQLTIVSYDTPTPGSTDQEGQVTGTAGNSVYFMNGTIATMGTMASGQNLPSLPGDALAHTFTIPQLGINIPVVGGSTVIANFYIDKAGTYAWICLTPCGFGPNGDKASMVQPGWSTGQVTVQ